MSFRRLALLNNAWKHTFCSRFMCTSSIGKIKKQVFSGIQPTGIPHAGNYFGAIEHWIKLQNTFDGDVIFSIVDLHSLTTLNDPVQLKENILDMVASLLACGIDTNRSILFQQSDVRYHTDLAWVLGTCTTIPRLQQLPQWKEKSKNKQEVNIGIFTYPVLQCADILLYRATHVPVGEDQLPHIALARHLARLFNSGYNTKFFAEPKAIVSDFKRIKSLRNIENKMSKSEENPLGRLNLTDSADEVRNKIKKAVADSNPRITYDPDNRVAISNLVDLYCAFTDLSPDEVVKRSESFDTVRFKEVLAEVINDKFDPIRTEIKRLKSDYGYLEKVLETGKEKASGIAEQNFKRVKSIIGLK